jgi:UDP-N-acetylmuramate dehydrogenase
VSTFVQALAGALGPACVREGVALAPLTTFKVGGRADVLLDARSSDDIVVGLRLAAAHGVAVTMLGGGSNLLIGDGGIRGLVIRPRGGSISHIGDGLVRADAAVTINGLVRWTINRGDAGLERWAGTPGTVGGAIFGNAHWRQQDIGELVESVRLARPDGTLLQVPADRMEFAYDYSRLKRTGEVVLWAAFRVVSGADPAPRRRPRVAGLPQADSAAGVLECGLHLHEPRSAPRSPPRGHAAVGGRADRSRRTEGRVVRRRERLVGARQLHRQ